MGKQMNKLKRTIGVRMCKKTDRHRRKKEILFVRVIVIDNLSSLGWSVSNLPLQRGSSRKSLPPDETC